MSYYMHDLEGHFCKTAVFWKLAKILSRKKKASRAESVDPTTEKNRGASAGWPHHGLWPSWRGRRPAQARVVDLEPISASGRGNLLVSEAERQRQVQADAGIGQGRCRAGTTRDPAGLRSRTAAGGGSERGRPF